ncbi:hypothetical protein D9M71_768060 [compost metagenome]
MACAKVGGGVQKTTIEFFDAGIQRHEHEGDEHVHHADHYGRFGIHQVEFTAAQTKRLNGQVEKPRWP